MKTYFNWIVVKDKKQYLWLLALPLGLLKAILISMIRKCLIVSSRQ